MSKYFITDTGKPIEVTSSTSGKRVTTLPRYGVWLRNKVVEVGDDLEYLQKKYDVPDSKIHKL